MKTLKRILSGIGLLIAGVFLISIFDLVLGLALLWVALVEPFFDEPPLEKTAHDALAAVLALQDAVNRGFGRLIAEIRKDCEGKRV